MAIHIEPKALAIIEKNIDHSFGLTVPEIASRVANYGRFSSWLNGNVNAIADILYIVQSEGVSPAFFASYEVNEGYNSNYGWLNHTYVNGTPQEDARSVAQWLYNGSNYDGYSVAWIDTGTNSLDFVPQSVKNDGDAYYRNLPLGTIGKIYIAGTAAAAWEVFYPLGLLKEYNGVMNYGKPLTNMFNLIEVWGGDIEEADPIPPPTKKKGLPIYMMIKYF